MTALGKIVAARGDRSRLKRLHEKYPRRIASLRGRGCFQAIKFAFGQEILDVRPNALSVTWETVLIGALSRELSDRHDILVHFHPEARDLNHLMPPFSIYRVPSGPSPEAQL